MQRREGPPGGGRRVATERLVTTGIAWRLMPAGWVADRGPSVLAVDGGRATSGTWAATRYDSGSQGDPVPALRRAWLQQPRPWTTVAELVLDRVMASMVPADRRGGAPLADQRADNEG